MAYTDPKTGEIRYDIPECPYEHKGSWWYCDLWGTNEFGPFPSKEEAQKEWDTYVASLPKEEGNWISFPPIDWR